MKKLLKSGLFFIFCCALFIIVHPADVRASEDVDMYQEFSLDGEDEVTNVILDEGELLYDEAFEILRYTNKKRADNGLPALTMDEELLEAAMARAAETCFYFSHTRPAGISCFTISRKMIAENIAVNRSPSSVIESWMNSQGHRGNILSASAKSIGIGAFVQDGYKFYVQCFGGEESSGVSQPANEKRTPVILVSREIADQCTMFAAINMGRNYYYMGEADCLYMGDKASISARVTNPGFEASSCKLFPALFEFKSLTPDTASIDELGNITMKRTGRVSFSVAPKGYSGAAGIWTGRILGKPGWQKIDGKWYYFYDSGAMATGWYKISGSWYCFESNGWMCANVWKKDSKGWCYLGSSGRMVTNGWAKDSKDWCYLGSDGYMVRNCWKKDSKGWCYLKNDGRLMRNGWAKDSKDWCYLGADGYMVKSCWKKDSKGWCYLKSDGRILRNGWQKDSKGWCYLGSDGYMVKNRTMTIGGKRYTFDANGHMK